MGSGDEQYQELGGGDSSDGSDLRIEDEAGDISPESQDRLTLEELKRILKHGDDLTHSKKDIVLFLSEEQNEERKNEYIRECYPKATISMWADDSKTEYLGYSGLFEEGLHLFKGTFLNPKDKVVYDWPFVRKLIESLIRDGEYLDKPEEKIPEPVFVPASSEQMTIDSIPIADTPFDELSKPQRVIPQEVVDAFLRLGGCTKKSNYRIYAYYRRANNEEDDVSFLRAEYEDDAIGLVVNHQRCAAAWDESGVTISIGNSVAEGWRSASYTWSEIDKRIRELIEMGQYLSHDEEEKAIAEYDHEVADRIANVYRDFLSDLKLPFPTDTLNYPEMVNHFESVITDGEKIEVFAPAFAKAVRETTIKGRRRHGYEPEFVSKLVQSYLRDPIEYPQEEAVIPPEHYVSQDEIDNELIRHGSGFSDGKFRIYSFFLNNKDSKERAKFMSNEYGLGGAYNDRGNRSHDGKGLSIAGGLDKFNSRDVLLSWSQVAKRVDDLIRKNRYLISKEVEQLDFYEKKQVA
ncbi:MAG: hypothetical protein J6128_04665, partial [Clostridia bacterium]|nr:hypothetical protein [Clostridia bacterium]